MTANPNFISATINPFARPAERPYVAAICHPNGELYDYAYNWETGQNYAMQGYIVQALSGDRYMTQEECQAMYDRERALFIDCWGRTTPFTEE